MLSHTNSTGGDIIANRISIIGSLIAALGFFFFPLLEIRPNRLASGVTVNLLELQGDYRYIALFILALVPLVVAFQTVQNRRGWALVLLGNLIIFLTLLLPAAAGTNLLIDSQGLFPEGTRISNPRVFTSGAIAVGLLGGYIVLFGGLMDLRESGSGRAARLLAGFSGLVLAIIMFLNGSLDTYSILVEFYARGETLGQRLIEHFVFVVVSLIAGLAIGIALGLWASRDTRVEPIILYAVGIIQTIPSLALFGVLLVPLARLGDALFSGVLQAMLISLLLAGVFIFVLSRVWHYISESLQTPLLIVAMLAVFMPAALFAVIVISFGFELVLYTLRTPDLLQWGFVAATGLVAFPFLMWLDRRIDQSTPRLVLLRNIIALVSFVGFAVILTVAGTRVLAGESLADLTVRDLGVSGIGTAPALIALTLYSLLPLVRNTYAGLMNIDPAIIDSGRGMGMTPRQIFFRIELPLAFPVIMAGVRNAGISLVGIAAVASIIGAGALGDFILLGVNSTSVDLILLGAIPAIILAVILDALLQFFEALFTSPGIRQAAQ